VPTVDKGNKSLDSPWTGSPRSRALRRCVPARGGSWTASGQRSRHEPSPLRIKRQHQAAAEIQLSINVVEVNPHRAFFEEQPIGDRFIPHRFADQADDLELPTRQGERELFRENFSPRELVHEAPDRSCFDPPLAGVDSEDIRGGACVASSTSRGDQVRRTNGRLPSTTQEMSADLRRMEYFTPRTQLDGRPALRGETDPVTRCAGREREARRPPHPRPRS